MSADIINAYNLPPSFLSSAIDEWKGARARFASAMRDFLNATLVLDETCNKSPSSLAHKDLALLIDNETKSISDDERRLVHTRTTLLTLRNRYAVPVNALPPEILALVFSMVASDNKWVYLRADTPTILSSVCNSWRQIATTTRTLWGHVVFNRSVHAFYGMIQRTTLWFERSQGAPLDVELNHPFDDKHQMSEGSFRGCLEGLLSHMGRLRSLKLDHHKVDFIHLALLSWMEHGTPGSLTELSINAKLEEDEWTPDCLPDVSQISKELIADFLRPIKNLSLTRAYIDWDSAAFTGLVELELRNLDPDICPTIAQLANALVASPMLRTLTLDRMEIGSIDIASVAPIQHGALRELHLSQLGSGSLESFFAAISPRSNQLNLCIGDDLLPEVVDSLQSHWGEIHIPIFRLTEEVQSPRLYEALKALRHTQTFAFHGWGLTKPMLEDLAGCLAPAPNSNFPKFHTISITHSMIACENAFRSMILAHPVRRLRLIECGLEADQIGLGEYEQALLDDSSPLCVWLDSHIPDFKVYENDYRIPKSERI